MKSHFKYIAGVVVALLFCVLVYSCGGGGSDVPAIDQSALPVVSVGENYRTMLTASGGRGPYRWTVAEGGFPQGLTLDTQTGRIAGQATQAGHFDATISVHDASNTEARAVVRIDVIEADAVLPPNGDQGSTQKEGKMPNAGYLAPDVHAAASSRALSTTSTVGAASNNASLPGLVSLLNGMPEGAWVQASLNSYADVWTPEELRPLDVNGGGASPPSKIIIAWSSFAWDSNRGDLILYGGGHANYPGNDVYRWHGSSRVWERGSLPSDITKDASGNYTALDGPDAAPAAAHTYDSNIFLPIVDRFLTFGGAAYNNGDMYRRATVNGQSRNTGPYLWDPNKADPNKVGGTTGSHVKRVSPHPEIVGGNMWQNRDIPLNLAGTPRLPASHVEGCTGYAVENGKDVVYVAARLGGTATQLFRYAINDVTNPKADTWTQVGGWWDSPQGQTVCSYDPSQKIFVKLGDQTRPFTYWNVAAPGAETNYEKIIAFSESTGEFASKLASGQINIRYCGFDFDPVRRQYALWCGGPDVWMLVPPATVSPSGWQLRKQIFPSGGAAPTLATGTGILGKWKYIPNLDAFLALQDSTLGNIWIYKPVGWKAPSSGGSTNLAPTVSIDAPASGSQFVQGATISVLASAADADGSVVRVDFYDGASLLARDTSAPWRVDWTNASLGSHALSAIAYDNQSASQTSSVVNIQVVQTRGGTVVLQDGLNGYAGTRDTYLAGNARDVNYGSNPSLIDLYIYYANMVRFAIFNREGGPVPDNAVIASASLELYKSSSYSLTLSAYRLLCNWQETQATWNSCRSGVPWATGGALGVGTDYLATADGAGLAAWDPGWVKIDVTRGLVAMQAGAPNYGWRLRRSSGDDINIKYYYTREYTNAASLRPKLTVNYSVP